MPAAKTLYQGRTFDSSAPADLLRGAEFQDCTFQGCRWVALRVQNCSFLDCRFTRCQLSAVTFSFCLMRDARMDRCEFRNIAWGGLTGRSAVAQPFASLEGCNFLYSDFSGLALAGFDFSRCQFRECVFDQCKLGGASFRGVSLGRSGFTRCDLRKADFRGAEGYAIALADNQLKDARFSFPEVVNLLEGTGIRIE